MLVQYDWYPDRKKKRPCKDRDMERKGHTDMEAETAEGQGSQHLHLALLVLQLCVNKCLLF